MRRALALKLAVSAGLITWLLWRTPLPDIGATLRSLEPFSALVALVLTLVAWWLSAVRLWCIAPQFRLRDVVQMTFVALYYGTVLPGQVAGDVIKAHRLSKRQAEPGQAVATTLVDRVVATFALFFLGACAAPWVEQAPGKITLLFVLAAIVLFLGTALLARSSAYAFLTRWIEPRRSARLLALLGRFIDALHRVLQHPLRLLVCFLLALVFHGLCTAIQIGLAHAIGFELPVAVWFLVYAGVALLLLLPISFAGVGLREGGYVGLLGVFGIAPPQALALSLMLFAYTLFGALLGWVAELADQGKP
jgi:glycosyltransferase 2 family protein